jgi:tripartite-type tricarboxylate transporter receptor subunit TctC
MTKKTMVETLLGIFRTVLLAAAAACLVADASAQTYPNKAIRLVVPVPAGGGTDILGRMVAEGLAKQLGQPVIVDNRGGASGMIGADAVLKAPADGYTLLMVYSAVLTVNQSLFKKITYDPIKDFVPVAIFADVPLALLVHPSVRANSAAELIELAKAQPGILNYAANNGTMNHLSTELFKQMAGINMVLVPYSGDAPALIDLIGGRVQLMFINLVSSLPHVKAGKLRALAIATAKRSPVLPDLPTVAESGLPGYETTLWYGVVAAAGTPAAIVNKLNDAIRQVQKMPEIKARLATMGADPVYLTPAELGALIKRDADKWGSVVRAAGIEPG